MTWHWDDPRSWAEQRPLDIQPVVGPVRAITEDELSAVTSILEDDPLGRCDDSDTHRPHRVTEGQGAPYWCTAGREVQGRRPK